jgi:hypothetical protein
MPYLDSAGNVDPGTQNLVDQWQRLERQRAALFPQGTRPVGMVPASGCPAGAEKATKGTH